MASDEIVHTSHQCRSPTNTVELGCKLLCLPCTIVDDSLTGFRMYEKALLDTNFWIGAENWWGNGARSRNFELTIQSRLSKLIGKVGWSFRESERLQEKSGLSDQIRNRDNTRTKKLNRHCLHLN